MIFRPSIWWSCLLVLAALAVSAENEVTTVSESTRGRHITEEEVTALCFMKDVEVSSITHVKDVFDSLGKTNRACDRRVESAVIELHDIAVMDREDVCTQDKADKVASWFKEFGLFSPENVLMIPGPLKKFFYAYGLLLSEACRKNMAKHLIEDSHQRLNEEDFALLNRWTDDDSFLSRMIKDPKDFDHLVLPKKLNKVLKKPKSKNSDEDDKTIYIETPTAGEIKKIQYHCQKRYKPFYSKLILPLITLSEAHFNFKGESVERDQKHGKEIYQWYRIVFMCESLADIEIIENPSAATAVAVAGDSAEGPKKRVRLLTKEEAEELKKVVPQTEDTLEQIEYEPSAVSLPDEILDWNNKNLSNTLKSLEFKFPYDDITDLIQPKPVRNMMKFMKKNLHKAPIYIASKMSGMKGTTSEKKFNDQMLVKFIDDYANQLSSGKKPKGGLFTEIKWLWELNKVKIITGILMISYIVLSTTLFQTFVVG